MIGIYTEDKKNILEAQNYLLKSSYPIVLSGAGISADSGIPTFRSESKLNHNATKPVYFGHYKYFTKNSLSIHRLHKWYSYLDMKYLYN